MTRLSSGPMNRRWLPDCGSSLRSHKEHMSMGQAFHPPTQCVVRALTPTSPRDQAVSISQQVQHELSSISSSRRPFHAECSQRKKKSERKREHVSTRTAFQKRKSARFGHVSHQSVLCTRRVQEDNHGKNLVSHTGLFQPAPRPVGQTRAPLLCPYADLLDIRYSFYF